MCLRTPGGETCHPCHPWNALSRTGEAALTQTLSGPIRCNSFIMFLGGQASSQSPASPSWACRTSNRPECWLQGPGKPRGHWTWRGPTTGTWRKEGDLLEPAWADTRRPDGRDSFVDAQVYPLVDGGAQGQRHSCTYPPHHHCRGLMWAYEGRDETLKLNLVIKRNTLYFLSLQACRPRVAAIIPVNQWWLCGWMMLARRVLGCVQISGPS